MELNVNDSLKNIDVEKVKASLGCSDSYDREVKLAVNSAIAEDDCKWDQFARAPR